LIGVFADPTKKNDEKQVAEREVVVSMTTSPKRINSIGKTIDCMMRQTLLPRRIVLNLPHVFKRDNSRFDKIPSFITENPLVVVNFTDDIGPATKILPTVKLVSDPEAYILSIDDDIYYPPDLIKTYVEAAEAFGRDAVVSNSYHLPGEKTTCIPSSECFPIRHLLEGYTGVLYKQRYLADMNYDILYDRFRSSRCRKNVSRK
jgi:glycosyltransferase involved in cell wall biosynthesis